MAGAEQTRNVAGALRCLSYLRAALAAQSGADDAVLAGSGRPVNATSRRAAGDDDPTHV